MDKTQDPLTEIDHVKKELKEVYQQLYQHQKSAVINQLATGIGHDFTVLLAGILSYANLLKEELKENSKLSKRLHMLQKLSLRSTELAKQLFQFANNDSLEKEKLDLNQIVTASSHILSHTLQKNITIKNALAQDLWPLQGNANQIMQILVTLGLNAQEAMPEGGELLLETQNLKADERFCRIHKSLKPGDYVRLSILNTGVSVIQKKEFCVEKIIQEHKASLHVYSELGRGTTFHIYFPVLAAGQIFQLQPFNSDKKIPTSLGIENKQQLLPINESLKEKTLLIVDDEDIMQDLIKDILAPTQAHLLFAKNGEEALEIYGHHKSEIHAIVLDLIMPKMDGVKTFERLRKLNAHVKVIFASGCRVQELVSQLNKNDHVGFIQKPYNSTELFKLVANA